MEDRSVFLSLKHNLEDTNLNGFSIDAYKNLQSLNQNEKEAIYQITYDILETYTHSIMVMFDNGTNLSDEFLIDIINYDTKESLTENYDTELHDDFIGKMLDKFES